MTVSKEQALTALGYLRPCPACDVVRQFIEQSQDSGHAAAPTDELHQQIMNLACKVPDEKGGPYWLAGYRVGHRDARHAAAELVSRALAAPAPTQQPTDPWHEAVIDEAATLFVSEDGTPREVLKRVIAANVQIALDPAVSSEAQALIDRGAALSGAAPAPQPELGGLHARLSALADELERELDSGAKWTKAQHTCDSVSGALRDAAREVASLEDSARHLVAALREEVEASPFDPQPNLTDEQVDRMLSAPIPGGSQARDWFLPHEAAKGLANVRNVVRAMVRSASPAQEAQQPRWCDYVAEERAKVLAASDGGQQ